MVEVQLADSAAGVAIVAGVIVAGAFLAGVTAARRFMPALAPTREGRLAGWIVAVLTGASVGVTVDQVWVGVRSLTETSGGDLQPYLREQIITSTLGSVLLQGGALMALAAIVYLLAPAESTVGD